MYKMKEYEPTLVYKDKEFDLYYYYTKTKNFFINLRVYGKVHRVNLLKIGDKTQYISDRSGNTKLLFRTKFCDGKKRKSPFEYYISAKDFIARTERVSRNSPEVHRYLISDNYKKWLDKKKSIIEKITGKPVATPMTTTSKNKSAFSALSRQREKYFISSSDTKSINDEDLLAIVTDADKRDIIEPLAFSTIGSWADIEDDN